MNPGSEYTKCHQCIRCGCTRPLDALKLFHRVDTVLRIDEHAHVCTDLELCERLKLERAEHLRLDAAKRAAT